MSTTSGWGRLTWGQANWNQSTTFKTGWGAQAWSGDGGWGDLSDQTISVSLTGIQITSSIGSVTVADMQVGLALVCLRQVRNSGVDPLWSVCVFARGRVGTG